MSECSKTLECFMASHWEVFFEAFLTSTSVLDHDFLRVSLKPKISPSL